MKTDKYIQRSAFIILLAFLIGGFSGTCSAQVNQLSDNVIPVEELGISIDEYQEIQNHILITLPEKSGPLSLLIDKVYLLNRKGGEGKEIDIKLKPIPFLPMVDYNKKEEEK